jgi:lipopolysaccharide export system permease protein
MTTLDRLYFAAYLRQYGIVWSSLLSLYIVVDLFTNLDDFSQGGVAENLQHVLTYYSTRISQIFDKLSEAMTVLAAVFTVAWMQRNNELLPQLSAGVSTRRVVRPILGGCLLTLVLGPLNQEFVIPRIADELTTPRDDPRHERPAEVKGAFDGGGVHLEGVHGFRAEKKVAGLSVTFPAAGRAGLVHLSAKEARYLPPGSGEPSGGWMLYNCPDLPGPLPDGLTPVSYGQYFLAVQSADFDAVTRGANWYTYASTPDLRTLLARPDPRRQPAVAVTFHLRLTRPLVGAVMVLLALAVILRDQNRHVFINAGLCLVLIAVFYAAVYGCKYLGENDFISPPLAAWLPVLTFGPFAVMQFDAVHT